MRPMIGSFAPHGINVVVITVILLSLSFSIVRDAIMPGTPQPLPISIGINDLPDSPNLRKIRSIINATRAMYPHASRKARNKNRTSICGTKPSTAPTPPTIPSAIRLVSQPAQPIASKAPVTPGISHSPNNVSFVHPVSISPIVETDT